MAVVSIWKAPQSTWHARRFLLAGFLLADIDDPSSRGRPDYGNVFFSRERTLAEKFAQCFGAGIIRIEMDLVDFGRLKKVERPLVVDEFEGHEILIAYAELPILNSIVQRKELHSC